MKLICRGATRIKWFSEEAEEPRDPFHDGIDLDISIAALNGFRDDAETNEIVFYEENDSLIKDLLQEGIRGSIAIYNSRMKDWPVEWWHVEVAGVREVEKPYEDYAPRYSVTFRSV